MTILLLGGTGRTSTIIAGLLDQAGIASMLASRSSSQCKFDWTDESTYDNPFSKNAGITSVYLIAPAVADIFTPMKKFIDLAKQNGVTRFVLLSSSAIGAGGSAHGKVHEYLVGLGVEYAVLRATWFMENLSNEQHAKTIREEGKIYSAAGDGRIPWVSVEDIAAVGFRALTDKKSMDTDPVILGPELLSYDDVAAVLSETLGRKIMHVKQEQHERAKSLQSSGMPAQYANMLASMDAMIAKGSEDRLNDVVLELTGKPPRKFRDFAEASKSCWM